MREEASRAVRAFLVLPAAILFTAAAAAAVPAVGGPAVAPSAGPADTVVLLSIDGMRWDYPSRTATPALSRMADEGASARTLIPPFPTLTFPSHASLVTGVYPDRHGIMNNEFIDRGRGFYRREDDASWLLAEPLWVTAERQGIRTAVYHWVFSYTPWHGIAATRRVPFSAQTPDAEKVDRILEWLSLEGADRPRLILSYLHGPDAAGHGEGPESPAVFRRVRQSDRLVGRVLRALAERPRSALVVVSDHGMAAVSRVLRTRDILDEGEARRARPVSSGAVCNVYCPDVRSCMSAQAALEQIEGATVHRLVDLPADLRYALPSRTGDLVAIAPRGAYFSDGGGPARPARGMHGFPPDEMEMRGIFRAWGAGVKKGARMDSLRAVDVAPFVCRLLGMDPAAGLDGRVPEGLLSGPRGPGSAPP